MRRDSDFVDFIKGEAEAFYEELDRELPTINVIRYSIPKRGHAATFLKDMRREFLSSKFEVFGKYQAEPDNA